MADVISTAMLAATLALNPMTTSLKSKSELQCLTIAMAQEARSRSRAARKAIGYATRNRVEHSSLFAETFCGVVKQPYQYSWVKNPQRDRTIDDDVWSQIVSDGVTILTAPGKDPTRGATHWCRREEVGSVDWCKPKKALATIDGFYFLAPDGVDKPVAPGSRTPRAKPPTEIASR